MLKRPTDAAAPSPAAGVPGGECQISESQAASVVRLSGDIKGFFTSLIAHTVLLVSLAAVPWAGPAAESIRTLRLQPAEPEEPLFRLIDDVADAPLPTPQVGANSLDDSAAALSQALVLDDMSLVPTPEMLPSERLATVDLSLQVQQAVGLTESKQIVKGMTGVGVAGIDGAVDRLTQEILQSMEESPTLVVWLFDQSGSLQRQVQEVRQRFDRIYEELGIVSAARQARRSGPRVDEQQRLLTSVMAFGQNAYWMLKDPTADVAEIRDAIDAIQIDDSGIEHTFGALKLAIDRFKNYRTGRGPRGVARNVLLVIVSDERGDDDALLEPVIADCQRYAIPVYVLGVPAPFGRQQAYLKYVDPDPQYDQTPTWAEVDQGPESLMPERIQLGYADNRFEEPVIDSGFGPYALSRLCYESGGIYFMIHPNRRIGRPVRRGEISEFASGLEHFFDSTKMQRYRPDYLPLKEYQRRVATSPLRQTLLQASQLARAATLEAGPQRFVRRDEAGLVNALTAAQQQAARLEPQLQLLVELLQRAEPSRQQEDSPRWLASYDLSLAEALAEKVRTEGFNAMLAMAKRGMPFEEPQNNTWLLIPSQEVSVGSRLEREAQRARQLLEAVAQEHHGTPWGLLASHQLERPLGWSWRETYTDLNPPPEPGAGNNNNPLPQDDQAQMLAPPPPRRPVPKL